jgi:hypothetical protein
MKRDNKDPMPMAENSARSGGGNMPYPSGAEKHGQKKGMTITAADRLPLMNPLSPEQPTRNEGGETTQHGVKQSGGNVAATNCVEKHNSKKAERVTASQRF